MNKQIKALVENTWHLRMGHFRRGSLKVVSIASHLDGKLAGHVVLGLGKKVISACYSGPLRWESWSPAISVVVPGDDETYEIGQILPMLPRQAVTVESVFKETHA